MNCWRSTSTPPTTATSPPASRRRPRRTSAATPAELDLAQCAMLAGLLQAPTAYNPIENIPRPPGPAGGRAWADAHDDFISPAQAEEAGGERLAFAATPFSIEAPHFVMWVQGQLETLLGIDRCRRRASGHHHPRPGLATPGRGDRQRRLTRSARARPGLYRGMVRRRRRCRAAGGDAGLVALDPRTGAVLALVGSPDYFDPAISGAVNAALAQRQPGSAIKPLTYTARAGSPTRPRGRHSAVEHHDGDPQPARRVPHRRGRALRAQQLRPAVPRPRHGARGAG